MSPVPGLSAPSVTCLCVYVQVCVYAFMYVCVYVHTCMCACVYEDLCMHMYVYVCACMYTCVRVFSGSLTESYTAIPNTDLSLRSLVLALCTTALLWTGTQL